MSEPSQQAKPVGISNWMVALIFVFGIAAGFLIAFSGLGFLQDSGSIIISIFLIVLSVVAIIGLLIFLFRHTIMTRLFGVAETQIELFADPLSRVAEGAVARDPEKATLAARDLAQLALARYTWLTTRRWIIASLTGLIAAMAALAGTALLFKQNQLIEVQSRLLSEQNQRIVEQTGLLAQQVELAEAQRNAALAVEVTQIAAALGQIADQAQNQDGNTQSGLIQMTNLIDPLTQLPGTMILRVVAASRAMQPYRFLDSGLHSGNDNDKSRQAMLRRRADLPETYDRMAEAFGWTDDAGQKQLISRPASPERGQLMTALFLSGIRRFEVLNHFGLDLAFAYLPDSDLILLTLQGARLSYADFTGSHISGCDFGAAYLENTRFTAARIDNTSFASVPGKNANPPYPSIEGTYQTYLAGADFDQSVLVDVDFSGAYLTATTFRAATLMRPVFQNADLGAASLAGAVLIAPIWDGAYLKSTDFSGAIVFGEDALAQIAAKAAPGTFVASRYALEPIDMAEVMKVRTVQNTYYDQDILDVTKGKPFRVKLVGEPAR
jgi:uncharacterized protein YjbI with pentapeptide repeats